MNEREVEIVRSHLRLFGWWDGCVELHGRGALDLEDVCEKFPHGFAERLRAAADAMGWEAIAAMLFGGA